MYYKNKFIYLEDRDYISTLSIEEIQRNLKRRTEIRRIRAGKRPSQTLYFEGEVYQDYFTINPIIYGTYRFPTTPFKIQIEGKMNKEKTGTTVSFTMKISIFLLVFIEFLVFIIALIAFPVVFMSESNNLLALTGFFVLPFVVAFFTTLFIYLIIKNQVAKYRRRLERIFEITE